MKTYGLIGYPLGHSFSAGYFREKFRKENIRDCEYRNFPLKSVEDVLEIITDYPNLKGLNVTIPYKKLIIPFLDEVYAPAKEIGAVNTVKIDSFPGKPGRILKGYNTDVHGFLVSVQKVLNPDIQKALILGTGGAYAAVKYALENIGLTVQAVSRKPLAGDLNYPDLNEKILAPHTLIVNTTPLGTYPDVDKAPDIPYDFLNDTHVLYDLVYNPAETLFMKKGKRQGAAVKNGYDMLVGQAEKAWEIWNL